MKTQKIGDALSTGTATVKIVKEFSGKFVLVTYLPAGVDLTPMIHGRYATEQDASKDWGKAVCWTNKIMGVA